MSDSDLGPYQAVVVVSFGGPEAPEEVRPFLRRVVGGRPIPEARLTEVAQHYFDRGGVSPINAETRALVAALGAELRRQGIEVPVVWGARNTAPFLADTLTELSRSGIRRAVALTTSAYPSYSSCRQYRENLWDAREQAIEATGGELELDRIRQYAHHPGFVTANLTATREALADLERSTEGEDIPHLVFVTHSIPVPMAESAGPEPRSAEGSYVDWHRTVAEEIVHQLATERGLADTPAWELAYCSRSGRPQDPWLEPDVNDLLEHLAGQGVRRVVLVPIGFTSDHMEVVQDLDTEAVRTAGRLGISIRRAATARTDPAFVGGLVDLLEERARVARGDQVLPEVIDHGSPGRYECPASCCVNLREPGRPALCEAPGEPDHSGEARRRSGQVWRS
ncbi:ferrochelatase [Enemella evansiae]|uniref:ferrochelatase n=1 Tax=Enemella evansiae TaxID=2016499 RepID=UPI000B976484|nr:ferrochelatase [Enemella evansiae]OYO05495.1 ferrochelatase [Enemella evansiae]